METRGSGTGDEVDDDDPAKGVIIALLLSIPIWAVIGWVTYLILR
jgi:hypothetical protein